MIAQCPHCNTRQYLSDTFDNKMTQCPACQQMYKVQPQSEPGPCDQPFDGAKTSALPKTPGSLWSLIGLLLGIAIALFGIIAMFQAEPSQLCILPFVQGAIVWFGFYTIGYIINQLERVAFYSEKSAMAAESPAANTHDTKET